VCFLVLPSTDDQSFAANISSAVSQYMKAQPQRHGMDRMSLLWAHTHPYVAMVTGSEPSVDALMDALALLGARGHLSGR
jgi:hypothetical protein